MATRSLAFQRLRTPGRRASPATPLRAPSRAGAAGITVRGIPSRTGNAGLPAMEMAANLRATGNGRAPESDEFAAGATIGNGLRIQAAFIAARNRIHSEALACGADSAADE